MVPETIAVPSGLRTSWLGCDIREDDCRDDFHSPYYVTACVWTQLPLLLPCVFDMTEDYTLSGPSLASTTDPMVRASVSSRMTQATGGLYIFSTQQSCNAQVDNGYIDRYGC